VHTRYLLDKLVFTKQGITGEKDCFKCLWIFESLLGPTTKSTFASLLGRRAVEEVFKQKGWLTSNANIDLKRISHCLKRYSWTKVCNISS
jgi:hypothetical protein